MPCLPDREMELSHTHWTSAFLPWLSLSDACAQHTGTMRTFSWAELAWHRRPRRPWQPWVPEFHGRWSTGSGKRLSTRAGWLLPHCGSRLPPSPPCRGGSQIALSQNQRCLDAELTASLSALQTWGLAVRIYCLAQNSSLLEADLPGLPPSPHPLPPSCVFCFSLKPPSSVSPFFASSSPPTAGTLFLPTLRPSCPRQVLG